MAIVNVDNVFLDDEGVDGSGGWIEWNGGACPVPENTNVHVKLREGYFSKEVYTADQYRWQHLGGDDSDIVAYKVVKEYD